MTAADVDEVLDVQHAGAVLGLAGVFPQDLFPFPRETVGARWRCELGDPAIECFAVLSGGALAGFVATRGDELLHFGIAPALWGSGLAAQAHDEVMDRFARDGVDRAWTWVFRDNPRGRRFYEKLGWTPSGEQTRSTFAPYATLLRYQRVPTSGS